MSEYVCRCGHQRMYHSHGRCYEQVEVHLKDEFGEFDARVQCKCPRYDDSVVPVDGERLVFGIHRQAASDAETAPAWPSLASVGAASDRRFRNWTKARD